ncbi:EamA family transporter RarD [Oxalobacteraceae bacterium OM1]|nr:EamA family transporter RarD [Oxalobacteraceae bacterium OM1]
MPAAMLSAAIAYTLWGLFPLYFKTLQGIPPIEILAQRVIWSLGFLALVLAWRKQWRWLGNLLQQPRVLAGFVASALLLSSNWFLYIWAVNNGHVLDASLGYFINPLFNVALGFFLLRERLRAGQWAAIALAAGGVLWLTVQSGHPPYVALLLAGTWAFYGLLRKTAALGALEGLSLETLLLFPAAVMFIGYLAWTGQGHFTTAPGVTQGLIVAAGPITAIPLLLFATGARSLPLSVLGLMQYISPTLQMLLGVWLYHEPFGGERVIGFALIWSALLVYSGEGLWRNWTARRQAAA